VDGIAGRLPLTPATRPLLPERLARGPALVLAPGGRNLFLATHETPPGTGLPERLLPSDRGDYLVWALSARRAALPPGGLDALEPAKLQTLALRLAADWHPSLPDIIGRTGPATISAFTVRTSTPVRPWPAGPVTVLGDAIHSMPPSRGVGANTALRDAALLGANLIAAGPGPAAVTAAIADYERQMRGYGFAAVKASVQAQRQGVTTNPLAFAASKATLRLLNALPAVRNRVFT
jgi:2-polyprenyl-6-methoxyphenol hydroxylase-like FAD-dependent oxidoreductase